MSLILSLPIPEGQTLDEVEASIARLPASDFERIPSVNPVVLKYTGDKSGIPTPENVKRSDERATVVKVGVGFLVLLWLATRKGSFR